MFSRLWVRLWASLAAVIILSLILAGVFFSWILRDYQTSLAVERLADLAMPITSQVSFLERLGASQSTISDFLAEQATSMGIRILLLDTTGKVVVDSSSTMQGKQVVFESVSDFPNPADRNAFSGVVKTEDGGEMYCVISRAAAIRAPREPVLTGTPTSQVVLAVPEQSLSDAWLSLLPGLSLAAVLALFVSVAAASLVARSIARPVLAVAEASEQVAKGSYGSRVPEKGSEEVRTLARSFNEMADQVGRSHQTLRDFIANASHELKTPLTSIQGFSQAMVDGAIAEKEDFSRAGEIINTEAERMRRTVDDLLLLSRMEGGQLVMERDDIDLTELVDTCVQRLRWMATSKPVSIRQDLRDSRIIVKGDSRRLELVVGNLLDNALSYTPDSGAVSVRLYATDGARGKPEEESKSTNETRWAVLRVHNTGSFIGPDDIARVFERFYRSSSGKMRRNDGAGLGLSIAKEIVQAHGGSVVVESSEEAGTEFIVHLPLESEWVSNH